MFYGRERELARLEERYSGEAFEFVPIYGRRRVGKTTLIKQFMEGKDGLYYSALKVSPEENFNRMASKLLGVDVKMQPQDFMEEIGRRSTEKRFVLVIDEYPNLAKDNQWVSDIIQNFIDDNEDTSKLFLILCGSSINMMEHEVLGSHSPLYGRRTGSLKLEPFNYFEARVFLQGFSEDEMFTIYGMVGGIPLYLKKFDSSKTLKENVVNNFLMVDSFFLREPELILMEEFSNPYSYGSVIQAVSSGCTRNSEIADRVDLQASNVSKMLDALCGLGILGRRRPVDNRSGKSVRYRVEDNFLAFYYRDLFGRCEDLSDNEMAPVAEKILKAREDVAGFVFEDICAQFMRGRGDVGTWWGVDSKTRTREEIDLVVTSRTGESVLRYFCECKYTSWKVGRNIMDKLISRSLLVGETDDRRYVLFSKSGFTDDLGTRGDLETYTLEYMISLGGRAPPRPRA